MKQDIEFFLTKLKKILIRENCLYCIPKEETRNIGFLETVDRIKRKKRNSLIFIRDKGRFYPLTEYEYLSFKGVLFYGEIAKLIKKYINIYELEKKKSFIIKLMLLSWLARKLTTNKNLN